MISAAATSTPEIELVVAAARNGVIGRENGLPWRLPDDLKRFKALTIGKPILMGRKTYASIGRPLPGRLNLVLTRDTRFRAEGVTVVHSWEEAVAAIPAGSTLMVIGGAEIYALALPHAHRVHLTEVDADVQGDVHFPELSVKEWREVAREERERDGRNEYGVSFVTLERLR